MMEGVLRDVADDQVRVLPDLTALVGLGVANEKLDEGGLAGTVRAENSDARGEGNLKGDVVELLHVRRGVLESNLAPASQISKMLRQLQLIYVHLEERLLLRLDTVEQGRVGELELVVLERLETVVRLGLWDGLDERFEVTTVALELEAVNVDNIGDDVVEEARVVRDDD